MLKSPQTDFVPEDFVRRFYFDSLEESSGTYITSHNSAVAEDAALLEQRKNNGKKSLRRKALL